MLPAMTKTASRMTNGKEEEYKNMDMAMFKAIADIVETVGWVCVVWELVQAAKILANPDPDGVERIIFELRRFQEVLGTLKLHLGGIHEMTKYGISQWNAHKRKKPSSLVEGPI